MSTLKTRFCPSPTGLLHLGNIRTALFNALLAKGKNGSFLLRIEDTDKARSELHYTEALQADMQWLGLQWDEGPGCEKDAGPYWQSQRQAVYDQFYHKLEAQGLAYPCFCTEEQLALARKIQRASGKPPRYAGTCRHLTSEQINEKLEKGLQPALRFHIPQEGETVFHDLVKGEQRFQNNDIGDFIIRRADGTPPFMYCNAIDDALMGVTHALRGEDHLTNTPRQIMLLKALELPIPIYGHISLIMGSDGSPLSKRTGSLSVQELREQGYLPIAVINYLARLGHYYAEEHFMTFAELGEKFSTDTLGSSPAKFDLQQLLHWQHVAVTQLTDQALWDWMKNEVQEIVPAQKRELFIKCVRNNISFPKEATHWAHVFFNTDLNYEEAQQQVLKQAGKEFFIIAYEAAANNDLSAIINHLKTQLKINGKALFQPLRVALTGEMHGPELPYIFELIGAENIRKRLKKAMTTE